MILPIPYIKSNGGVCESILLYGPQKMKDVYYTLIRSYQPIALN